MSLLPRISPSRSTGVRALLLVTAMVWATLPAGAQSRGAAPDSLTDSEFWTFFTTMSEPDGYFLSENFVSNELSFQEVIPTLQRSLTRNGVYLGVGPEQNFTYIANLGPRMAVIFDIRRQNAMQHLMYKALFELSPTRAEFVARLFSRPSVARLGTGILVKALFDSATAAPASDSAYKANLTSIIGQLTDKHAFALPPDDVASIEHVYSVFFAAGPEVNYGYRSGSPAYWRSTYPSFGALQAAMNADSAQTAFLATEENYQAVRRLQLRNLIVPVVGDFGGPSAIRAVGDWLRSRQMTVTAFYVSNVEQYLFRDPGGAADRFYGNVSALPIDTTSRFIRSVPGSGFGSMSYSVSAISRGGPTGPAIRFIVSRDARGNTVTQTFRDSAGVTLVQTTRDSVPPDSATIRADSATIRARTAPDSAYQRALTNLAANDSTLMAALRAMTARRDSLSRSNGPWQQYNGPAIVRAGGLLASGIASMDATLKAFFLGELKSYNSIVDMTRVSGWK